MPKTDRRKGEGVEVVEISYAANIFRAYCVFFCHFLLLQRVSVADQGRLILYMMLLLLLLQPSMLLCHSARFPTDDKY